MQASSSRCRCTLLQDHGMTSQRYQSKTQVSRLQRAGIVKLALGLEKVIQGSHEFLVISDRVPVEDQRMKPCPIPLPAVVKSPRLSNRIANSRRKRRSAEVCLYGFVKVADGLAPCTSDLLRPVTRDVSFRTRPQKRSHGDCTSQCCGICRECCDRCGWNIPTRASASYALTLFRIMNWNASFDVHCCSR